MKQTSTEACLHATSSMREIEHFDVSTVIYHKFSHGAVSYTLNGENVNVMLEYLFNTVAMAQHSSGSHKKKYLMSV